MLWSNRGYASGSRAIADRCIQFAAEFGRGGQTAFGVPSGRRFRFVDGFLEILKRAGHVRRLRVCAVSLRPTKRSSRNRRLLDRVAHGFRPTRSLPRLRRSHGRDFESASPASAARSSSDKRSASANSCLTSMSEPPLAGDADLLRGEPTDVHFQRSTYSRRRSSEGNVLRRAVFTACTR